MKFTINHIIMAGLFGLMLLPGASHADMADIEVAQIETEASAVLGYRGFSLHGEPARAAEYRSLDSSPTLELSFFKAYEAFNLDLDVDYLGDDEYTLDAGINAKGRFLLELRSERMFHNLDHIPYDNGMSGDREVRTSSLAVEGSRPDDIFAGRNIYYTDHAPGDTYGLRIDLNEAKVRVKYPDYPAHFNISYWRYEKKGEEQLRFLNHLGSNPASGSSCTGCHVQSKTRSIDRVTEEVKASIDAHAGYVDVVVEGLYRKFHDREAIPEDGFRLLSSGWRESLPHDEDPDSTLREATLKLNTSPAGGLVGSASFTRGKRENDSDLTTEGPIKAETDYTKTTADINFTPNERWAFNMRYRLLDMDTDATRQLSTYGGAPVDIPVREAIDITRNWYEATANYRPWRSLTLKAELRIEDIKRDYNGSEPWDLPGEEVVTRAKLGFHSRLLERSALKISGWAAYQHSDDPAYGTSPEDRKELFLSANYAPKGLWGLSASASLVDEENDGRRVEQAVGGHADSFVDYHLAREQQQQNFALGGWLTPRDGLTLDVHYGFFRTAIDQDLLFGTSPSSDPTKNFTLEDDGVDLRQTVHTLRAGLSWQVMDLLNCRLEGYHIRSKEYFSPEFERNGLIYTTGRPIPTDFPGTMSSTDLRGINELDVTQNGVRGRINWQIDENWGCTLEASYDDYNEHGNDLFDGSVQTTMVSFSRSW